MILWEMEIVDDLYFPAALLEKALLTFIKFSLVTACQYPDERWRHKTHSLYSKQRTMYL
jgi:hypothetical protein